MTPVAARFLATVECALERGVPFGAVLASIHDGLVPGWVDESELERWAETLRAELPIADVPSIHTLEVYTRAGLDVRTGRPI